MLGTERAVQVSPKTRHPSSETEEGSHVHRELVYKYYYEINDKASSSATRVTLGCS